MVRMIRVLAVVACTVSGFLVTSAAAGPLAPSKASSVVTLATGITPCLVGGIAADVIQNADGTTTPFVIPPKQVFVVTAVEASVVNAGASSSVSVGIQRVIGNTTNTLAFVNGTANAQGIFFGQLTIPNGAIVKPGVTVCVFATSLGGAPTAFTLIHGFFAPNR